MTIKRKLTKTPHKLLRGSAGFTLIEMLVVLVIIGLIMGLVGPRVLRYLDDSRVKAAKLQIDLLSNALELYYLDNGRYPSSSEGLKALVGGPYLKTGVPQDPWKNEYMYRAPGQGGAPFEIMSLGSDGREGGSGSAADIVSAKN